MADPKLIITPYTLAYPSADGRGMTIRAEFAKAALQGLRAAKLANEGNYGYPWEPKDIAKLAVLDADAMIAELNATAPDAPTEPQGRKRRPPNDRR